MVSLRNKRIIISRTDRIGDVVLTLPLAGVLKKSEPSCTVIFLCRKYTMPVVKCCKHVDEILYVDDMDDGDAKIKLPAMLQNCHADMIIHVFPTRAIAVSAKKAKIPVRIGTSHRLYHLFTCNKLIHLGRKNSALHEAQQNLKLLSGVGLTADFRKDDIPAYYGFDRIPHADRYISGTITKGFINLIIHPKTKGSAREWDTGNFAGMVRLLSPAKYRFIITGTHDDGIAVRSFFNDLGDRVLDMTGKTDINQMIALLNQADGIISCSTGPLHLAAAMGKAAIGIYPPVRPMHAGRWGPLGMCARVLTLEKKCTRCLHRQYCECINLITPGQVAGVVEELFNQKNSRS